MFTPYVHTMSIWLKKGIRELNPNDIDKLVSVKGLTLRSTSIIPDMKVAFFRCNACGHTVGVKLIVV